ncbi:hypothetical protein Tco_1139239, partial [Tanacetum coccineum]
EHRPGGFTTEDQRKPATLSFGSSSYGRKQSRIPLSPANYASMHPRFQKLEDAQKVQLQTTLKKAETELRRQRQSFCFKARPLPSFYNERETPKSPIKKTPQANQNSLTPARKPPTTISQPSSVKKSSRRLWKTSDQNPADHPLSKYAALIDSEDTHYPMYIISQPSSVQKSSRRLWKTSNQNPDDHPLSKYAALIDSEDTHYPIYIISQPSSVKNSSKDVLNLLRAMRLPVIPTNARSLLVKTISNGNSSGLTNDTHNIKNIDDSDILGGLTL